MPSERARIEAALRALESQRALLGSEVTDAAMASLRAQLASLAAEPAAPVLKQVTILFVDVVGSTSLSQRLDPEQTSDVMDGALARFAGVVTRHGGKVLKYAGDSVLAVFGAVESREDDAERAVRAGVALLEEGRAQGDLVRSEFGHEGFNVRVGVHTGGVLLGAGVDADGGIRGQAVNVAARMEQSAPAGALRISHDTYRHVRGIFIVEPQPPLAVKGVDEPMITYLVSGIRPREFRVPTRGIEGVETRMVGRVDELRQLQEAFLGMCKGEPFAALLVVGEAGLGKSRLLHEFRVWLEASAERFAFFQGRADPSTQDLPYGVLRDILAWHAGLVDDDSMDAAKAKLELAVTPYFDADDGAETAQAHAHVLGHLIGLDYSDSRHVRGILDSGAQIRDRGFHAAAQLLRKAGKREGRGTLLVLDDLHWADDGSLDFLQHLEKANHDVPTLIVGMARPSLFLRRSEWAEGDGYGRRIDLDPLDSSVGRYLAEELLKRLDAIPSDLRDFIAGTAEGNPFYMEELVKLMVDQGTIDARGDEWTLQAEGWATTKLPTTLTGVLQARLDSLDPDARRAAQQAAVIGFVFWDQALAALEREATAALPRLTRREFVLPRPASGLEGIHEFTFHHQLLQQVVYDTVLARSRREYHARAAEWLSGVQGARTNDFVGLAAQHFDKAGEIRRACELYARAVENAVGRYANETLIGYVTRALFLLADDDTPGGLDLRWRLLAARERALDLRGRRAEQGADIESMRRLSDVLGDDRRRADAAKRRSYLAMRSGDTREQTAAAREAIALAERAHDIELRLRAQNLLATGLNDLGDVAEARRLALEGLAEARLHELRRVEVSFINTMMLVAIRQDDQAAVLEWSRQQYRQLQGLGDWPAEAVALISLGTSLLTLGERTESRRYLEEGLRLARAIGDRSMEPYAQTYLALIALRDGDCASALSLARAAYDTSIAVEGIEAQIIALLQIGEAELASGNSRAATAAFALAKATAASSQEALRWDADAGIARAALARDDDPGAMLALEELLAHLDAGGSLDGTESRLAIYDTCYRVLVRAGDARADAILATAHAELQRSVAGIADAGLRQRFLADIPANRAIVEAWEKRFAHAPPLRAESHR